MSYTIRQVLLLAVLPCCLVSTAFCQSRETSLITGQVIDAKTAEPLAGVNVFLSGTTMGAMSRADGSFEITGIPEGAYDLIASMVGYWRESERILVTADTCASVQFELQPRRIWMSEIEVTGEPPAGWRFMLARFKNTFVGESENARRCEILNPEVLNLAYDRDEDLLSASSSRPLLIGNRALGYLVTVELDTMTASPIRWTWRGVVRFTELEPGSRREERRWKNNREDVWTGSMAHFLHSYINGKIVSEGFTAMPVGSRGMGLSGKLDKLELEDILTQGKNKYVYLLHGPVVLWVRHRRDQILDAGRWMTEQQGSWLDIRHVDVEIDPAGWMFEQEGVVRTGRWFKHRFAEELPRDYRPAEQ